MLFNPLLKKRKLSYFTKGGFYCIWTCVGMLVYCGTEEGAEWTRSQINKSEDDLTAVGAEPGHHGECCKHVTTATITQLWARSAILFDKMTTEFFRLKAQGPKQVIFLFSSYMEEVSLFNNSPDGCCCLKFFLMFSWTCLHPEVSPRPL